MTESYFMSTSLQWFSEGIQFLYNRLYRKLSFSITVLSWPNSNVNSTCISIENPVSKMFSLFTKSYMQIST